MELGREQRGQRTRPEPSWLWAVGRGQAGGLGRSWEEEGLREKGGEGGAAAGKAGRAG